MAIIDIKRTVNLDGPTTPEALQGTLYGNEVLAHKFTITATQSGAPLALGGTVSGMFIREADGETIPLTGTAINGAASVILIANCYYKPGRFSLTIFNTQNGATTAVYACTGNVRRTETDTVIDPSGEIQTSVTELLAEIATAVDSIPADYSALLATIAPTFSNSTPYYAGDYVWHEGYLYRFVSNHAAGSWTGTDVALVTGEFGKSESNYKSVQAAKAHAQIVNGDTMRTGRVYMTLTPDDFTLEKSGYYFEIVDGAMAFTPLSNWSVYGFKFGLNEVNPLSAGAGEYHYGERMVFRFDDIQVNNHDLMPMMARCGDNYYPLYAEMLGRYFVAEEVFINVGTNGPVLKSASITATAVRDFENLIVCEDRISEFDNIVVFGDSIFANWISHVSGTPAPGPGNGVTAQFGALMGLPVNYYAEGGATLSTLQQYNPDAEPPTPRNVLEQIALYLTQSTTPRNKTLILLDGGTNDQALYHLANLGEYGSSDANTIYGAIYGVIAALIANGVEPWQIVLTTPIPKEIRALSTFVGTNASAYLASVDSELTAVGYAIFEIGAIFGCNVINGYRSVFTSMDSPFAQSIMMPDNGHPSELGAMYYAHYLYRQLSGGSAARAELISGDDYNIIM